MGDEGRKGGDMMRKVRSKERGEGRREREGRRREGDGNIGGE